MRNVFVLAGLVTLSACRVQQLPSDGAAVFSSLPAFQAEASSEAVFSSQAEVALLPSPNQQVWTVVEAWSRSINWSDAVRGTNEDAVFIDDEHVIPAHAMQAEYRTAKVDWGTVSEVFMNGASRDALNVALLQQGWTSHISLDADGPTGTMWGYQMQSDEGLRFLILSASGEDCTDSLDAPVECSSFVAKITITDALAPGDDL